MKKFPWLDLLFCFLLVAAGFFLRGWPELRGGYWPIGYDTFNSYVPDLMRFDGNFLAWLSQANLLYFFLWPWIHFFHMDPVLVVKIAGPTLYGVLAAVFYVFCRKFLSWNKAASITAAALLILELPMLRFSWDLLRNMLGFIFLLPTLYFLQADSGRYASPVVAKRLRNLICIIIGSILIVFTHQLTATIWFIIVFVWLVKDLSAGDYKNFVRIFFAMLPSALIFSWVARNPITNTFGGHMIYAPEASRIFNYVDVYKNRIEPQELSSIILNLFWLCYKFILPLAILGFWFLRRNIILTTMTIWLLIGTFSSLIFGGYGLFVWDRWMIMLAFPFTIYAIGAFWQIGKWLGSWKIFQPKWTIFLGKMTGSLIIIIALLLSFQFIWPFLNASYDEAAKPFADLKINSYFPSTMVHNAVGFDNISSVLACIDYLNKNTPDNSVILVDNRYRGLVLEKFNYQNKTIYSYPWASYFNYTAIDSLRDNYMGPVFTIWPNYKGIDGFKRVYDAKTTFVYRDKATYQEYLTNVSEENN